MVRQVSICFVILALCCTLCATAQAQSYSAYDGNMSSTYVNYFRDIANNMGLGEHYVAFRSGQNEYIMAVGKLEISDGSIVGTDSVKVYRIATDGNYSSTYSYGVSTDASFSVSLGNEIVYSDLGDYPDFVERGSKYEILSAVLLAVALLGVVVKRIFV